MTLDLFNEIYNLLVNNIFGGSVQVGTYQDLICSLFSASACLFVLIIPFLVVYKVIKLVA